MNLESIAAALLLIFSVIGAIVGTMKFMLKDVFTAISVLDGKVALMDAHVQEIKKDNTLMEQRWVETNKRMDGVYHVLLKRIKEE